MPSSECCQELYDVKWTALFRLIANTVLRLCRFDVRKGYAFPARQMEVNEAPPPDREAEPH